MNRFFSKILKMGRVEKSMEKFDFDSVESSWQITWDLIFKKYIKITVLAIFLAIVMSFVSVLVLSRIDDATTAIFMILVVFPTLYIGFFHYTAERWFMKKFAEANGMKYKDSAPLSSVSGSIFEKGRNRAISHVIIGEHENYPIRVFKYKYSIGRGRSQRNYNFTVLEVAFEKTDFPHILLRPKKTIKIIRKHYERKRGNEKKIALEDPFNKRFELYATPNYEVEMYQIFTPEFLKFLKENSANFSIEFSGKNMYIYDKKHIKKKKNIQNFLDVGHKVIQRIGPLLDRLHDDFDALHKYYKKPGG